MPDNEGPQAGVDQPVVLAGPGAQPSSDNTHLSISKLCSARTKCCGVDAREHPLMGESRRREQRAQPPHRDRAVPEFARPLRAVPAVESSRPPLRTQPPLALHGQILRRTPGGWQSRALPPRSAVVGADPNGQVDVFGQQVLHAVVGHVHVQRQLGCNPPARCRTGPALRAAAVKQLYAQPLLRHDQRRADDPAVHENLLAAVG